MRLPENLMTEDAFRASIADIYERPENADKRIRDIFEICGCYEDLHYRCSSHCLYYSPSEGNDDRSRDCKIYHRVIDSCHDPAAFPKDIVFRTAGGKLVCRRFKQRKWGQPCQEMPQYVNRKIRRKIKKSEDDSK